MNNWVPRLERLLFDNRIAVMVLFAIISCVLGWSATRIEIDAGFDKTLPRNHPYMEVFKKHGDEFGGANRVLIAVVSPTGNIFSSSFMETLKNVTDAVFFLPGVNKATVRSLFTPNVRYTEVVEDGLFSGRVVPVEYTGSDEDLHAVQDNSIKAGVIGHLVANNLSAALVSAELIEIDPQTREQLDYFHVARLLEENVRQPFTNETASVHIVGFAKAIGDIADGAASVFLFFGIAFVLTAILVYVFIYSIRYTALLLLSCLLAALWTTRYAGPRRFRH